jgi:hypothetical protein
MSYHRNNLKTQFVIKMTTRKRIVQGIVISSLIIGAVLLGVGSAGAATPLIVAGILLVMASGVGGFMISMEPNPMPVVTYRNANAATA